MPYSDPQKAKECAERYRNSEKGKRATQRRNARYRSIPENREKLREWGREYRKSAYGKKVIRYHTLAKYSLSPQDYENLLQKQNGLCAFCGQTPRPNTNLDVEHDHSCCDGPKSCGKCIRGLVHRRCNSFIATVEKYSAAVTAYLERKPR